MEIEHQECGSVGRASPTPHGGQGREPASASLVGGRITPAVRRHDHTRGPGGQPHSSRASMRAALLSPSLYSVAIFVNDIARAVEFYRDTLGLPMTKQGSFGAEFLEGETHVGVHPAMHPE